MPECKNIFLQIHQQCCNALSTITGVEVIMEIISVRFIFLTHLIMENLDSFTLLCVAMPFQIDD